MQSQREAEPVEHPHPCQGCLKIEKAESGERQTFSEHHRCANTVLDSLYMLFHDSHISEVSGCVPLTEEGNRPGR